MYLIVTSVLKWLGLLILPLYMRLCQLPLGGFLRRILKKRDRSSFFSYNLIIGLCQNGFYKNEENFTNSESQNVISLSILYISLSYGMYGNKLKIISIDEMSILRIWSWDSIYRFAGS